MNRSADEQPDKPDDEPDTYELAEPDDSPSQDTASSGRKRDRADAAPQQPPVSKGRDKAPADDTADKDELGRGEVRERQREDEGTGECDQPGGPVLHGSSFQAVAGAG